MPPQHNAQLRNRGWTKGSYSCLFLAAFAFVAFVTPTAALSFVNPPLMSTVEQLENRSSLSRARTIDMIKRAGVSTGAIATSSAASSVTTATQVYPPVLIPNSDGLLEFTNGTSKVKTDLKTKKGFKVITQTLMEYVFSDSYNVPFVGKYSPPKGTFNRVAFTLTVYIGGVQYDRLGSIWLGDTEVWRTTTAEPLNGEVTWTYVKDMSSFLPLLTKKQTLIFSLNNIYNSMYTGAFNTTLTATYWTSEDTVDPADEIIAISSYVGNSGQPSIFTVPSQNASYAVEIPRRTNKAIITIAATGQSAEEFWYQNTFTNVANVFEPGLIYGYGPFREVQLYIDNELAGVAWPYPNIFSGGVSPSLWHPVVGIDTFDLRENEIDITPWLPLICDGKKHTFSIQIAGVSTATGNGKGEVTAGVGSYWLVSGKIFLWYDPEGSVTSGTLESYSATRPAVIVSSMVGTDVNGTNETLNYSVAVSRTLSVKSKITTANGTKIATWHQKLQYSNVGNLTAYGFNQVNLQSTTGTDKSSSGYARQISYPLYVAQQLVINDTFLSITANVSRTQIIQIAGEAVFPSGLQSFDLASAGQPLSEASTLTTSQNATGYYQSPGLSDTVNGTVSYGTNVQEMTFSGNSIEETSNDATYPLVTGSQEFYSRHVEAVNGSYITDLEALLGGVTENYAHSG